MARSRPTSSAGKGKNGSAGRGRAVALHRLIPDDYLTLSAKPLQSLVFLLPMIVIYELGTLIFATDYGRGVTLHIKAELMLLGFFQWFGLGGFFLPGIIVVAAMIGMHLAQKEKWRLQPRLFPFMLVEATLFALPLMLFMLVLGRHPGAGYAVQSLMSTGSTSAPLGGSWQAEAVFSVGAGIYEELLFRVAGMALIHFVMVDLLALPDSWGSYVAMTVTSLAFGLYHFSAGNPFNWQLMGLYTVAGFYFACIYTLRGPGIVAASHAIYDLMVVFWNAL